MNAGRKPTIPTNKRESIVEWYLTDLDITLEQIAQHYSVTRERIRQIVSAIEPNAQEIRRELAEEKKVLELEFEFAEACRDAIEYDRKCVTCGAWVLRGEGNITCSHECAVAWTQIRDVYELDGGQHRERCAETILRNPSIYRESMVDWANRVMEGDEEAITPKRRWVVEGSKRSEALKKFRPEIYAKIVGQE